MNLKIIENKDFNLYAVLSGNYSIFCVIPCCMNHANIFCSSYLRWAFFSDGNYFIDEITMSVMKTKMTLAQQRLKQQKYMRKKVHTETFNYRVRQVHQKNLYDLLYGLARTKGEIMPIL